MERLNLAKEQKSTALVVDQFCGFFSLSNCVVDSTRNSAIANRSRSASYKSFRSDTTVVIIAHARRQTVVIGFVHYMVYF